MHPHIAPRAAGGIGEVLDKTDTAAAVPEEAAMATAPTPILASPVSLGGVDADADPDGPAPMIAQDTDPLNPAPPLGSPVTYAAPTATLAADANVADAAVAAGEHAEDGVTPAAAAGLGGIRGTSADVQRDYSDPSVNIQGELRELSDIAGLRSPMGGLLADPERLLQSQSWWTIASAGGAGDASAGSQAGSSTKGGSAHGGTSGGGAARDVDGGQDAARLARQRKVL